MYIVKVYIVYVPFLWSFSFMNKFFLFKTKCGTNNLEVWMIVYRETSIDLQVIYVARTPILL